MSAALLLVLLSTPPQENSVSPVLPGPRPFHEINRDIRSLLRHEATAATKQQRAAAIYEMTGIYRELLQDPRLVSSETLTGYKNRLWGRLTKVKNEIEREIAREERRGGQPRDTREIGRVDLATQSLSDALSLAGSMNGGPAHLLSHAGGAFGGRAGPPDFGPGLVDLIQRTIAPDFWDVHGGPGTIVYYRPLRVLVVRATDDVHHQLGGVLGGLRAAGR